MTGAEFTIQAISDGRTVVFPPSTYDYPYRYDGDEGPGTGGMGSLSMAQAALPFMTEAHYRRACEIVELVIERLRAEGRHFSGVMNSGFFATAEGVKVIEFNARFGDPECMNIMSLFEGSWTEVMREISERTADGRRPCRCGGRRRWCCTSSRPTTRCAKAPRTSSRSTPPAWKRRAAACSSPRPWPPASTATARSAPPARWRSRAPPRRSSRPASGWRRCAETVPVLEWRREVGDERYLRDLRRLVETCEHSALQ